MANQEKKPNFLQPKDFLAWGGYVIGAIGTIAALNGLGVTETANEVIESLGFGSETEFLGENMKTGIMGTGFVVGFVENIFAMGATFLKLNGKVRLRGTGHLEEAKDGVMVANRTCVDARTPIDEQDHVEPGSGLMQGLQLRNMILASLWANATEGQAADFLTGYMMGRALPAALVSTLIHASEVVTSYFKPPERVIEQHHNKSCGWSATGDWLSFYLKFTHKPDVILDTLNIPSRILQLPMQALEQSALVFLSGFRHITYPGKPSTIQDNHSH